MVFWITKPFNPTGHCMYIRFSTQEFHVLPTQCIYVFCVDLRTNSYFITETVFTVRYGLNLRVMYMNPSKPSGHYMYHQFNIQQFYVLPTQCICVFCVDLRTNSGYFPIQH